MRRCRKIFDVLLKLITMKKLIYILLLGMASLAGCSEDNPVPSLADTPSLTEFPDMTKPLIAAYKNDYDVNIIYRFNDSTDFRFALGDKGSVTNWKKLEIKQLSDASVDYGLKMLDSLVLKYFKDEVEFRGETFRPDFKRERFPRKLFLVDSLGGGYSSLGQTISELNDAESQGYFSFLWNGFEPMFGFNSTLLATATSKNIQKYRNSALYGFLSALFVARGVYDEFPAAFFEPVADLYGTSVNELAREEEAEVYKNGPRYYYLPEWYMSKGFALTNNSPGSAYGVETKYTTALDTARTMTFPLRERDFRNMLHVMICETNQENIRNYFRNDVFIGRMRILIEEMYRRGIDVFAINPAAEEFFND